MLKPFIIEATVETDTDLTDHAERYEFTIKDGDGVERQFIIDTCHDGTTDIWVLDNIIEVGDSPEDGFATFTPVS